MGSACGYPGPTLEQALRTKYQRPLRQPSPPLYHLIFILGGGFFHGDS
jgi:hypothetical protein